MESRWMNKNGKAGAGTLLWIILIGAAVYLGIQFGPPYFTYFMIKSEAENNAAEAHHYSDEQIATFIFNRAKEYELPLEKSDIIVERRENDIEVKFSYKIDVNFFDRYAKTLYFNIDTVKPLKIK